MYTPVAFDWTILKEHGEINASISQYRLAIDLKKDLASAWLNLGVALGVMDRDDEAMDAYKVLTHRSLSVVHSMCLRVCSDA